jgi:RNA polymerase sigma-70 factor, ECF subfamily
LHPPVDQLSAHIASLRRYAMALTGDPVEADDLVQTSLERALTHMRNGTSIHNLRAYLFSILHNVRMTELRRNANCVDNLDLDRVANQLTCQPAQHQRAEANATLRALKELTDEQQEVILLICVEGLTYKEAASALGIPIGTVMSRLSRGRAALIDRVAPEA